MTSSKTAWIRLQRHGLAGDVVFERKLYLRCAAVHLSIAKNVHKLENELNQHVQLINIVRRIVVEFGCSLNAVITSDGRQMSEIGLLGIHPFIFVPHCQPNSGGDSKGGRLAGIVGKATCSGGSFGGELNLGSHRHDVGANLRSADCGGFGCRPIGGSHGFFGCSSTSRRLRRHPTRFDEVEPEKPNTGDAEGCSSSGQDHHEPSRRSHTPLSFKVERGNIRADGTGPRHARDHDNEHHPSKYSDPKEDHFPRYRVGSTHHPDKLGTAFQGGSHRRQFSRAVSGVKWQGGQT